MNIYILLYIEFFKIGLFSVGGGYATLPFLYHLTTEYDWFSVKELSDMVAISNITPGPIGINMATFAGYKVAGIIGSIISTVAVVTPALIIVLIISNIMEKFKHSEIITGILTGLRPAACALLTVVGIKLFTNNILNVDKLCCSNIFKDANVDIKGILLLMIMAFLCYKKVCKNPIFVILIGFILGIIFNYAYF